MHYVYDSAISLFITVTVKALYQGFRATKELLKGAKQIADSRYEKTGTYAEAVDDFTSVGPTQVKSLILAHAVRIIQ